MRLRDDRRERLNRVFADYVPVQEELWPPDDPRFTRALHYVLKNQRRLKIALERAAAVLPDPPFTVLDMGPNPGSLIRLLRKMFPSEEARLLGAGLMISEAFARDLQQQTGTEIFTVNLDPANPHLSKEYPVRVPLEAETVGLAFALEIIEHLHSPLHLLEEAFRVLRSGGHLLVTTVNVSRIGNVFKLLAGGTNFDRLTPIDYRFDDDEWGPHVREYTIHEVAGALQRVGFEVVKKEHFQVGDTRYNVKSLSQRCSDVAKLPFLVVPHFRDGLLIMGKKP